MKHSNMMEERKEYRIIVPVLSLLTLLCMFLPFVNWEAGGISYTGFSLLKECFGKDAYLTNTLGNGTVTKSLSLYGLYRVVLLLPVIASVVSAILPLAAHKKSSYRIASILSAVSLLSFLVVLFSIAKKMNALALCGENFMVKNLCFGYWFALILSLAGIVAAMKATKTSPAYIILITMSIIWILPILWVILTSFRGESGSYTPYFWPKSFTVDNYVKLFTETDQFFFLRWFGNTFIVAVCSCIISTFYVLSTAYVFSRLRFKVRKAFMNVLLILGMFPGFMSMIAVYYILKGLGLSQTLAALVLVYSGGAALTYYIAKGFFDTIPKALDEAAIIDGATRWGVFTKITMPLSKPIIIYTILTSFTAPWMDFIFAKVIMGDNYANYTVALGLWTMLQKEFITTWYTRFAAGAVVVSIPIALLFIVMQKYYVEGLSGSVKG